MASPVSRVLQRVAAASIGGYVLSTAASACLSYVLPMSRADATLTGFLVGFLLYVAVVMWVFAARSLSHLWWQLGGVAIAFTALAFLFSPRLS